MRSGEVSKECKGKEDDKLKEEDEEWYSEYPFILYHISLRSYLTDLGIVGDSIPLPSLAVQFDAADLNRSCAFAEFRGLGANGLDLSVTFFVFLNFGEFLESLYTACASIF